MTFHSLRTPRKPAVAVMLLALIVLPAIFFYVGLATSLALGTSAAAIILTMVSMRSMIARFHFRRSRRAYKSVTPGALALLIICAIVVHASIAAIFQPFDELRAMASLVPLTLILIAGCGLGDALLAASDVNVDRATRRCFALFSVFVVLAVLHLQPPSSYASPKPVFPYTEPSALALIFTPFLMFYCIRSDGWVRIGVLFFGVAAALLLENLTLLIGCILIALISVRGRAVIPLVAGLGLCLLLVATQLDLSYYLARLDFSQEEGTATSSLVYLQGWQLIGESLARSGGWGLGFQQLGVHGTNVPAADIIFDQVRNYGNVLDGGFTFSKVVSEFGAFGLLLICCYVIVAWRAALQLRRTARQVDTGANKTFARCVVVSYILELFVRGSGYFTGTAVLVIASLWLMSRAARISPEAQTVSPQLKI